MNIETELKLHLDPAHLALLKRHPLLRALSLQRARTVRLYSVYYDTPGLKLKRHAMALRLRRIGQRWVQTLKGGGQASAGLHQRNEWELPVAAAQLDCTALAASGGTLPRGARSHLQPIFVTDFTRNLRLLEFEGARIEVGIDSGEIRAGHSSRPISEVELELKSGAPLQLFRLALALLDRVPLRVEHSSKAEYGYALFEASRPAPSKGRLPVLHKTQNANEAMHALIVACLEQVQANVPGAQLERDEEFLHQVRVGLRRLRVALAMARHIHDDAEAAALRAQVALLNVALGRVREWDVFITQTLASLRAGMPEHAGLHDLLQAGARRRKKMHAEAVCSLSSTDFQRLLLRLGAWLQGTQWQDTGIPIMHFARRILQKKHGRMIALGSAVQDDPAQLHALRIACKKLRYSAEMVGSLFAADAVRDYLKRLAGMQDALGALQDIAVADRLLHELDSRRGRDTLALVRRWMEHEYAGRVAEFGKSWRHFARQNGFWG